MFAQVPPGVVIGQEMIQLAGGVDVYTWVCHIMPVCHAQDSIRHLMKLEH